VRLPLLRFTGSGLCRLLRCIPSISRVYVRHSDKTRYLSVEHELRRLHRRQATKTAVITQVHIALLILTVQVICLLGISHRLL